MCPVDSCCVHLHLDFQLEILLRLPAISVLRFRAVCKKWNAVTRTSDFTKKHYSLSIQSAKLSDVGCFLYHATKEEISVIGLSNNTVNGTRQGASISFFFYSFQPSLFLATSPSNGFLCLAVNSGDQIDDHTYLYNPNTKEMLRLPNPGEIRVKNNSYRVEERFVIGFLFNPTKDEFKFVFSVTCPDPDTSMYAVIYTLQLVGEAASPWNVIGTLPYHLHGRITVVVNGNLHWLVTKEDQTRIIFSLDLEDERFLTYSIKNIVQGEDGSSPVVLAKFQDSLGVLVYSELSFGFWIMEDYGNADSWNLMYTFLCRPLECCRNLFPYISLSCIWKDGKIFFCYLGTIISYDPKTKASEEVFSTIGASNYMDLHICSCCQDSVVPFVSSLVSLKEDTLVKAEAEKISQEFCD